VIYAHLANPLNHPGHPFGVSALLERFAVDVFGPLPKSKDGNSYVLVICDCFTRWIEAIPFPNQEAETVVRAFVDQYISHFGVPLQIHSDRGTNLTSKLFADMCDLLQLQHTKSTPQHPQSNGNVERFNRTLATMLTLYCDENQRNWDQFLPQMMMTYRSATNTSTGVTPNRMVFGREVVLPLQACVGLPPESEHQFSTHSDYAVSLHQQLQKIHE